jgi:hypothetical protein
MEKVDKITVTAVETKTQTQSIALASMLIVGIGGILAMAMSIGHAAYSGCAVPSGGGGGKLTVTMNSDLLYCEQYNFNEFQTCFGQPVIGACVPYDFNNDNTINTIDFSKLGAIVGNCEQPRAYVQNTKGYAGEFTIKAGINKARIRSLTFEVTSPSSGIVGGIDEITSLKVSSVDDLLGETAVSYGNPTIITVNTPSLIVDIGKEKRISVLAIINEINVSSPAESGANVLLKLVAMDSVAWTNPNLVISQDGMGEPFKPFIVYKSIPTFIHSSADTKQYGAITGQGFHDLYRFGINTNLAGPIGLYKFSFQIDTKKIEIAPGAYRLYESTVPGDLSTLIAAPGDFIVTQHTVSSSTSSYLVETYVDVNDDNPIQPAKEHIIIDSGATKFYTLQGAIVSGHDAIPGNEEVTTTLLGDNSPAGSIQMSADEVDSTIGDNLIWSDLHLDQFSTSTAVNAQMFYNGYQVIKEIKQTIYDEEPIPSLGVITDPNFPADRTVIVGTQDIETFLVQLDATNSSSDIQVSELQFNQAHFEGTFPDIISVIDLMDVDSFDFLNGDFIGTYITENSEITDCLPSCSSPGAYATTTINFASNPITVPQGGVKNIGIQIDMGNASTTPGSFQFSCSNCITSAVDNNLTSVIPNQSFLSGAVISLGFIQF